MVPSRKWNYHPCRESRFMVQDVCSSKNANALEYLMLNMEVAIGSALSTCCDWKKALSNLSISSVEIYDCDISGRRNVMTNTTKLPLAKKKAWHDYISPTCHLKCTANSITHETDINFEWWKVLHYQAASSTMYNPVAKQSSFIKTWCFRADLRSDTKILFEYWWEEKAHHPLLKHGSSA